MKILIRIVIILAVSTGLWGQPAKDATDRPAQKDSGEAQQAESFYKLAFAVYELDGGKRINQRDYMVVSKANYHSASIRVSTRVPIYTEETDKDKKITYIDVGLEINCNLKEQAARLQAECGVNISSFLPPEQLAGTGRNAPGPVLRATRTSSFALLTLGKPMVIATVDDINSPKRMQIEVTATKVE